MTLEVRHNVKSPVAPATRHKLALVCLAVLETPWVRLLVPALLLAAIATLSLLPGDYRPHAPFLPDAYEHLLAYTLTAFAIAALTPGLIGPAYLLAALVAYAGLLELCQLAVPHRTASIEDFIASGAGATLGVLLAIVVSHRISRALRS